MPYVYVEPDVFLEHNGVTVFYTYNGDSYPCKYWFTTDPATADGGSVGDHFDARLFVGKWEKTPTVFQWEEWWKPRFKIEHEAVEALVRTAIDDGKIVALTSGNQSND